MLDVSRRLRNGVPVWPGSTEFSFGLAATKEQTGSVNVGEVTINVHTGTHVDAPFHVADDGGTVGRWSGWTRACSWVRRA